MGPIDLNIQLFGSFCLSIGGTPCSTIDTPRLQSLVAYLALKPGVPQTRSTLAFLFWPDSTEKQALTNLRHLLHELRKALPDAESLVKADTKTIAWVGNSAQFLDVLAFESSVEEARTAKQANNALAACEALEKAIALYQGDLLPGCYDEWLAEHRERFRLIYFEALIEVIRCAEENRSYGLALQYAQKLRLQDPTREATYRDLMRLYSLDGDRAKALQTYRQCAAALKRELNVEPSEATKQLHDDLLNNRAVESSEAPEDSVSDEPEYSLQGRQDEWSILQDAWSRASKGQAHLVTLAGEAGIGKSRLAQELRIQLARQGIPTSSTRSYAAEGRLPYAPVCQWLRSATFQPTMQALDPVWLTEISRIMPEFRAGSRSLSDPSTEQRQILFEALSRAVLSKPEALMLVLDDLQWTDQESLEWLRFLLRFAPQAKLLVVGTIRSEEVSHDHPLQTLLRALRHDGQITEIHLGPTSKQEAALIAKQVAGRELNPRETNSLYESTEGNPLFIIESVRAGIDEWDTFAFDSSPNQPHSKSIPPKIHAVFSTRLSQLTTDSLELARIASVIGRAFTIETLVDVSGMTEDLAISLMDELWEKRIIRELAPNLYDFTHDRLREVTYAQISTPKRRLLHRKTSDVLESHFADNLDSVRAQLASHYEEAGQVSKAIDAYREAGFAAKNLNATREAIRLFSKALELLEPLPQTRERMENALELNTALGTCQVAEYGYHAPGVQRNYETARRLCQELGQPTTPPILRALALLNLSQGQLFKTIEYGNELAEHYKRDEERILYVESEYVLGVGKFWIGRLEESAQHLKNALDRYDSADTRTHIELYAQDPRAVCLCRLGGSLFFLGQIEDAIDLVNQANEYAITLDHPHTASYVHYFGAQIYTSVGELDAASELLAQFEALSAKRQLLFWESRARMLRGYIQVMRDGNPKGIRKMAESIDLCIERGHTISVSQYIAYLAKAHAAVGDPQKGIDALDRYQDVLDASDECFFDGEILRIRSELLAAIDPNDPTIPELLESAMERARRDGNRLIELRVATSRVLQTKPDLRPAAIEQLQSICAQFDQGFDRKDLANARALLDPQSASASKA